MKSHRKAWVSLSIFFAAIVVAVSGALAFLKPFSLTVVSIHTLFGLTFVFAAVWHIRNNFRHLRRYLQDRRALVVVTAAGVLIGAGLWNLPPVRALMSVSPNRGPANVSFVDSNEALKFSYAPTDRYLIEVTAQKGVRYPGSGEVAIWLENDSSYHVHTLHVSKDIDRQKSLPYWFDKRSKWQEAKRKAGEDLPEGIDVVSEPTENSTFDPAFYVVSEDRFFSVMLEVAAGESSVLYSIEIDNSEPARFQLMELIGIPVESEVNEGWEIAYDTSAVADVDLIFDSILVTVYRGENPPD